MQLENPKHKRAWADLIASIPAEQRAALAPKLMKIERSLVQQGRRDTEIVESVIRILEHPGHQRLAERLRNLIINSEQK